MKTKDYLNLVAHVTNSTIPGDDGQVYRSNFDNSYLTRVEMEEHVDILAALDITEELSLGLGFSPTSNKWYGWSHRAIYGFTVGSTCKKGDVHYSPANIEDALEDCIRFWEDENHSKTWGEIIDDHTVKISWEYSDKVPNESLRLTSNSTIQKYPEFGKGEWTAKTLEDAKQMAKDFRDNVS